MEVKKSAHVDTDSQSIHNTGGLEPGVSTRTSNIDTETTKAVCTDDVIGKPFALCLHKLWGLTREHKSATGLEIVMAQEVGFGTPARHSNLKFIYWVNWFYFQFS